MDFHFFVLFFFGCVSRHSCFSLIDRLRPFGGCQLRQLPHRQK